MTAETPKPSRKLALQLLCALVSLPLLYVAASGPLLLIASKCDDHRATYARVCRFYRPLSRAAISIHLETPLSAYMHVWGIQTINVVGKVGTGPGSLSWLPP